MARGFHQPMEEHMKPIFRKTGIAFAGITLMAGVLAAGTGMAIAGATQVTLSGSKEVPPVQTSATGKGTITVNDDMTVSGSVTTKGVKATMAHIHEGAAGNNGGVAIPLEKKSDNEWAVPAGAKLTDAQYKSYKAGNLYVNVHSDLHKAGEIRGQLKP
jgi:CHRD domain